MTAKELEKLLAEVTQGEWTKDIDLHEYGWSFDTDGENTYCGLGTSLAGPIAIVAVPSAFGMDDELDANVALILLAPTLARRVIAAEKLAGAFRWVDENPAAHPSIRREVVRAARAEWEAAQ